MFDAKTRKLLGDLYTGRGSRDAILQMLYTHAEELPKEERISLIRAYAKIEEDTLEGRYRRHNHSHPDLINAWTKYAGDMGESWTHLIIFNADNEEQAGRITARLIPGGIWGHGTGCDWDCSGRSFHHAAQVREIYPGRWIATQWGAIDC